MPVIGPCRVFKSFYKGALRLRVLCKISDRKNIAQKFRLHFLENHDKSIKATRNYKRLQVWSKRCFQKRKLVFHFRQREKIYQIKLIPANYHKRKTNCNTNHSTTTILAKNASNREKKLRLVIQKKTKP